MIIRDAEIGDAEAIARVHVDTWRSAYPGIIPDDVLDGLSYSEREARHRARLSDAKTQTFTLVAEDDRGQVVGFALGGPERPGGSGCDGELYAIYVLANHQRKGVGGQLAAAVVARLAQGGARSMLVWVLADSPWRRFYERLGGRLTDLHGTFAVEGAELAEVAYAWDDLRAFPPAP